MAITTEPSETIRNSAITSSQVSSRIGHGYGVSTSSAPAAVATPLPPLSLM